jgi:hypothetical protein
MPFHICDAQSAKQHTFSWLFALFPDESVTHLALNSGCAT